MVEVCGNDNPSPRNARDTNEVGPIFIEEARKAEEYRMVSMMTENNSQEESFAALFEESLKHEDVKEGDIVKGKVINVGKDHVVVDIGYKSEGTIPLYEFTQADGSVGVKEGDEIDVFLESRENEDGLCVLSKEKADRLKVWDEISGACERDELIEGTISARVKGGLSVTIRGGVKAFLPGSTCGRSATSTPSSARRIASRSSSSTRNAAISCCRAACCSRRSAPS
jgi:hypothetical protein